MNMTVLPGLADDGSGPVFASQCAYVVTLAGVLWGILIYGEAHSTWVWASLVVMIIALSLVRPRDSANAS